MLERLRRLFSREQRSAQAAAADPVDPQALLEPACAALAAGREDDAVRTLEAVLRAHPKLAEGHRLLAEALRARGALADARDSYTLALHYAPQSWPAHYGLGLVEMQERRIDRAIGKFEQALEHGGDNAAVCNSLGAAHVEAGACERSVEYFRRAIALDSAFVEAYSNLGYVLFRELEQYGEGAALIEQAIALGAARVEVKLNWALVLQMRGEVDRALAVYDELLERDPTLAQARLNRALIRLARGDFERGWEDYEARKASPGFPKTLGAAPEWDGADLSGRSIAIFPEQGVGDEIMFASCVPDVMRAARSCTIVCNPKLEKLFRRSFAGATVRAGAVDTARPEPHVDYAAYIGSLPRFVRRSGGDFPSHHGYLRAAPARVAYWKERLAALPGGRKVGISWRGGTASTRRSLRSIPLEQWRELLQCPDSDFVSLQHTDCVDEIAAVERAGDARVHHWADALDDYDETAALVSALDLVVSVQAASVHLCGALGVPVWALIPEAPEWRYGEHGESMPWYSSVTLVRKRRGEDWTSVIADVARRLKHAPIGCSIGST